MLQVKGNLDQATAGVSSTVGQAVDQFTESTKAVTSVVSDTISSGQAAVQQTFDSVNAQVSAVAIQVGQICVGELQFHAWLLALFSEQQQMQVGGLCQQYSSYRMGTR